MGSTRDISRRTAKKKGYSLSSTYGKRTASTPKTVSVSSSSFGVSGAGSNASLLSKYGSPEAKTATATSVTPLTATQKARSNSIPKTAIKEATELNIASPTSNVILGNRFDFGQSSPISTSSFINNLAYSKATVNNQIQKETAEKKNSFLEKLDNGTEFLTKALFTSPIKTVYQGYSNFKIDLAEIRTNTAERVRQEQIEKASIDAQAEKQIAEQENILDLYDVSFLEKLGIGRSAEEKRIQDLVSKNAFYTQQEGEAQSLSEAFQRSEQATNNPIFQGALASTPTAENNTVRNIAIVGAVALGLVFLFK